MGIFSKKETSFKRSKSVKYDGWTKCKGCLKIIHCDSLSSNLNCCPECDYHYKLARDERINSLADENSFNEIASDIAPVDALFFEDVKPYHIRLKEHQQKTGYLDAITVGSCNIHGEEVDLAILDFFFMGGSMGSVVGEKMALIIEHAIENRVPLVAVISSGGARMQESSLSLMQMAKTSMLLKKLSNLLCPYITVLTNPTTGGVLASFGSLGDIILAEPGALIGFAGPKAIAKTSGVAKLPTGAQTSEFLLEKGWIDRIVPRSKLKSTLFKFLEIFSNNRQSMVPSPTNIEEKI